MFDMDKSWNDGPRSPDATGQSPAAEPYARPRKKKEVEPTRVHPPLLALIDVLFTLMLFFVIAARTKLAEGEIPGSLPNITGTDEVSAEPIAITVRPLGDGQNNCQYELDGQALSDAGKLYERLSSRPKLYGIGTLENIPVLIRPLRGVRWRWAVEAYNQALRAGYHKVRFDPGYY
ncbi:MAG: biopolymer transporter ExbD [Planctomycetes bacterium]|nr:biopolymer transporter ExbD [Planctomycetota bacterium]